MSDTMSEQMTSEDHVNTMFKRFDDRDREAYRRRVFMEDLKKFASQLPNDALTILIREYEEGE